MPFPPTMKKPAPPWANQGGMPQGKTAPPPFRAKPAAAPMRKMMADGGSADGIGAPSPVGGMPDMPPPAAGAGATDPDNDGDQEGVVRPDAVNYHDDAQSCSTCEYMGQGGNCAVLKMQVSPEGACNAYEAKGQGDQGDQGMGGDMGGMPGAGGDMGGTDQGTSGYQQ